MDFRGVPLSCWIQSSLSSCLQRQRSWPCSLPSRRSGTSKHFRWETSALCLGRPIHVVLRPQPGYVPKVPTTPFRDQVVNLQALPPEEADPALALLCPVRALRMYVDHTWSFRSSEQLFVCYGGQQKGKAHWAEVGPLDSGCFRLGVPIPRQAVHPGGEGSLHMECCHHVSIWLDSLQAIPYEYFPQ